MLVPVTVPVPVPMSTSDSASASASTSSIATTSGIASVSTSSSASGAASAGSPQCLHDRTSLTFDTVPRVRKRKACHRSQLTAASMFSTNTLIHNAVVN